MNVVAPKSSNAITAIADFLSTDFLQEEIKLAYGENPELSPDYARIINRKNWERLTEMISNNKIIIGAQNNSETNFIAPTLIDEPSLDSLVMKDEIFGPILPILSYDSEKDLEDIILKYEKPLALYVFSNKVSFSKKIIQQYSFGGGCINDTMIQFVNKRLPFGGVGNSGIGAYHGRLSFDIFSHKKAVVNKGNWLDLPLRYAPYNIKLSTIKKLFNWL